MKKVVVILCTLALIIVITVPIFARSSFVGIICKTYKPYSKVLIKHTCITCHVGATSTRNAYGAAIEKEIKASGKNALTPEILRKVEDLDSDGDGFSNIDEIKAGTNPGDPKSSPSKH